VHEGDTALIRFQAIPGVTREGKVVRSGFSIEPTTRTLQTEIDIPNSDGHLHPGWYVTVTIAVNRKQVWALPSNAIDFRGQQNYFVYLQIDDKPVRTQVIIGPSDDSYTEVVRKYVPGAPNNPPVANTNAWPTLDGSERVLVGNLDVLAEEQAATAKGRQP
jgi:multidrug efflux pump subunit AcrA (membrane-fusion protein)